MTRGRQHSILVGTVAVVLGVAAADAARRAPGFSLAGDSLARIILGVAAGWAVLAAGLAVSAGGSRVAGRLLAAAGCAWLAAALATPGARPALLFTLGLVLTAAAPALIGHALLTEAGDGRHRPLDRVVVIALYVSLAGLLGVLPTLAYDPAATGCMSCRANLLGLADGPGVVADLSRWGTRLALLAIAACVGLSLWRLARAPSVRRRRAGPLVMPGCAYLALVAAELGHAWRSGFISDGQVDQTLWTLQAAALLGVAAGVGLLLAAARRRRARLARLVVELAGAPRPGGLRDALADTLGDPSLELLNPGW